MKYLIYCDVLNKWRWYLNSPDGERLATGEGYTSREKCEKAIAFTKSAGSAPVKMHTEFSQPVSRSGVKMSNLMKARPFLSPESAS